MRNHIVFKFIAIVLCAAALVSAAGSGLGLFALTESGLHEKNVDELYTERLEQLARNYGINRWERYASQQLGGAGEELAASFYRDQWTDNVFRYDRIGYRIVDGEGNSVMEEPLPNDTAAKYTYEFPADHPYLKVLSEKPYVEEIPQETVENSVPREEIYLYDAVPENGAEVYGFEIGFADGSSEGMFSEEPVGFLRKNGDGMVEMLPTEDNGSIEMTAYPVEIVFYGRDQTCLYEASNPEGVMDSAEYRRGLGQSILLRKLEEEIFVMDAIPPEGCNVSRISVTYADGYEESGGGAPNIGFVDYDEQGHVRFTSVEGETLTFHSQDVTKIALYDENGAVVYQASNPDGAGKFYMHKPNTEEQRIIFLAGTQIPVEETMETIPTVTIPVETMPVYADNPDSSAEAMEATVAVDTAENGETYSYYNYLSDQRMEVEYTMESADGYTVQVQLAGRPLTHEGDWELVRTIYAIRKLLPVILGVGLLLFAITAVYLCCAAARKPKSDEVRPGGLNCIPLDLYLAMAGCGVMGMAVLGMEGSQHLLQNHPAVGLLFGGLCAYAAGLLIVGFCFACAAQFKTPGGYWWRHSFCGFILKLAGILLLWLKNFLGRMLTLWLKRLWPGIKKVIKGCFGLLLVFAKKVIEFLKKTGKSIGKKINRFYSLLPLTWQWMLCGSGLVLMLFVAAESRRVKWMLISVLIGFGLILYGAHCFGILMESARRMSKGDLDEKVDDKLMTGSFREFADDLNSLADVAVVAAREQLKSERMKTELITNVSHDIKTPLTSIINYVDLLQKPHTQEDQEKYLEVLDRQSQRLKKLIDDLMEMSKASTGNMTVEIDRVDAAEAVNQALGEFADKLEKAELYPVFRQPEQPVYMMADGRLVWRVMSNLLSNAVKYALPGTRLYVDLQKLDNKVILSLKNISREELNVNADELLERFVRGDASRNTEGSGLGLNIARSLMELQKGQLQILVDGDLFKVTLIFPGVE